jgi:hypothetical protein
MAMKYIVKRKDITGAIEGYPIEIIQAAVDRGVEQGCDAKIVIRGLQYSTSSGFSWADTPEGNRFWSQVMGRQRFDIFFQRYPREFVDGVHYFIIDKGKRYWVKVAETFLGNRPRFAFEGSSGDIFYIVKYGNNTVTGFALKDSPRYRWAIENGTEIKC